MVDFSLKKGLSPLNWSLMLSGTWIHPPRNRFLRILVLIHRFALIVVSIMLIYKAIPLKKEDLLGMMYRTRHTIYNSLSMIFVIVVVLRNKIIREVLDHLQPLVTKHEARSLYKFLVFSFLYKILRLIPTYLNCVAFLVRANFTPHQLYSTYSRINSWNINSVILFASIIKVIHVAEKMSMKQLIEKLEKFSAKTVYFKVKAFAEIKERITSKISILILLYFMFIFIESVVAVVRLNNSENELIPGERFLAKGFLLDVLLMIIDMIYLASLTTKLCQGSKQDLKELENKIVLTQDTKEWSFVFFEINRAQNFEYQACDCFAINKHILTGFTASLITFTVLFVQLVSSSL